MEIMRKKGSNIFAKLEYLIDHEIVRREGKIDGILIPILAGIAFGCSWERIGVGVIWNYKLPIELFGIPIIIILAWGLYVYLSYIVKRRILFLLPITFTIVDVAFQKIGLWRITSKITPFNVVVLTLIGYFIISLITRLTLRLHLSENKRLDKILKVILPFWEPFLIFFLLSTLYYWKFNILFLKIYILRAIKPS